MSSTKESESTLAQLRADLDHANYELLSDDEEARLLASVRHQAEHNPQFRPWLRKLPRSHDSPRAMVYEALVADLESHGTLLVEELDEALSLLKVSSDPKPVLVSFFELGQMEAGTHQREVRQRLTELFASQNPLVRCWAADLLSDFIEPEDTEDLCRLQTLLERDPSWRVRCKTYRVLSQVNLLPATYKLRWADRIRLWFQEP